MKSIAFHVDPIEANMKDLRLLHMNHMRKGVSVSPERTHCSHGVVFDSEP